MYKVIAFFLILLLVTGGSWWLYDEDKLYQKTVVVQGIKALDLTKIKSILPTQYNNIYWTLNKKQIEQQIRLIPLVNSVNVVNCDNSFISQCYEILIQERAPKFLAVSGQTLILLDEHGQELYRTQTQDLELILNKLIDPKTNPPKVLVGLYSENSSVEQIKSRFNYVNTALDLIEKETALVFSTVELEPNGELKIKPLNANFFIRFDNNWNNLKALKEEALRLKLTLQEVFGRINEVLQIDLAYDKLVVVSYKESEKKPSNEPKSSKKK